jgi:hypothetical protein
MRDDALAEALQPARRQHVPHGAPLVAMDALARDEHAPADGPLPASVGETVGLRIRGV